MRHMENTILFLHGALVRTSRLLLEGLSAYAASHGMHVLNICPPRGADAKYLRDIADFWEAIGIVVDCGAEQSMPLPAAASDMAAVLIDLDRLRQCGFQRFCPHGGGCAAEP